MNWAAAAAVASLSMVVPCLAGPSGPALNKSQLLLQSVAPKPQADFTVEAWANRPDGTYSIGQEVQLFLRGSRDAYYTVLAVGPEGDVVQLYPAPLDSPQLLRAGDVLTIPGQNDARTIRAAYPAGRELVRIIGSTSPLTLLPSSADGRVSVDIAAALLQNEIIRLSDGLAIFDLQLNTIADAPCLCLER
jgi:hypothetical protein